MNKILETIKDSILMMPKRFHGDNVNVLMNGTIAQESHLGKYRKQINGEALGISQIERPTFNFVYKRYELLFKTLFPDLEITFEMLEHNDPLAIIIARLKYWTIIEALPDANNLPKIAAYWKKYYNTPLGKGTEEQFIENYNALVVPHLA